MKKNFLMVFWLCCIPISSILANNFLPPQITITTDGNVKSVFVNTLSSQTTGLTYTNASSGSDIPTSYSINWNAAANAVGLSDQSSTSNTFSATGGTITGINVPSGTPSGFFEGVITITGCCVPNNYTIRLRVIGTVTIGEITWADKNLDVVTYNNGDTIPQVANSTAWANLTTGAWCYYNNDATNNLKFGKLYNWYALHDVRGLVPTGYHIPTLTELDNLFYDNSGGYIGDLSNIAATSFSNGVTGTNSTGFNAFPTGSRGASGTFWDIDYWTSFWSRPNAMQITNALYDFYMVSTYSAYQSTTVREDGISIRLAKNPDPINWTGGAGDNLWSNPGNWNVGRIPLAFDNILGNTGVGSHIQLDIDADIENYLTLGRDLIVSPNKTLSIPVSGEVTLNFNNLTFQSDATGSGQLGMVYGKLSDINLGFFERYFPARRAYRLFSPAATSIFDVHNNWMEDMDFQTTTGYPYPSGTSFNAAGRGIQITGLGGNANGFDETATNNPSLFKFNYVAQNWDAVTTTTDASAVKAGDPYRIMIRGDRGTDLNNNAAIPTPTVITTIGQPYVGVMDSSLTLNALDWVLIGNPYQSIIDGVAFAASAQNVTPYYYAWDPTVGTRGAYVTYDFYGGSNNFPGSEINQYIQPGQAVFLQADLTGVSSLKIEESMKVKPETVTPTITNVFKPAVTYPTISFSLNYSDSLANNAPAMDGMRLILDNSFSNTIDRNDARKLSNLDETIALNEVGILLSIEKRGLITSTTEIPLSITQYKRQQYTLRINWSNPVDNGVQASIKDNYTNTTTPIHFSTNTDYSFTVDNSIAASKAADRFALIFVPTAALPVSGLTLGGIASDKQVKLTFTALNEREMSGYAIEHSADGIRFTTIGHQQPSNGTQASVSYSFVHNQPITGTNYYRIKGSSVNGQVQYSNISVVKFGNNTANISVVPNPVEANRMQLQVNHLKKGSYNVTVSDVIGRVITTREVLYDGSAQVISVILPSTVRSGSYYVKVEGQGNSFTQTFLVK